MSVAETIWTIGLIVAAGLMSATAVVSVYSWVHAYLTEIGPRFSFRTMLIAMALVAAVLGLACYVVPVLGPGCSDDF